MPNVTFYGVNKLRQFFFSLSKLEWGAQEINSKEFAYIWYFQQIGINSTKFERKREFIFKVTFAVVVVDAKALLNATQR